MEGISIVSLSLKPNLEAVVQKCSVKKVFLKISQNLPENNRKAGTGFFLWILQNFNNTFFIEHLWWQLLQIDIL